MRSVVFRYGDVAALSGALSETRGSLPLPEGESVGDGEWILAIFEIGSRRRATAAAARGVRAAGDTHLEFERRDWERLLGFVNARSEHMKAARPVAVAAPIVPTLPPVSDAPPVSTGPRSRRLPDLPSSSPIESSRVPFGARVLVVDEHAGGQSELQAMLAEMSLVVELVATLSAAESLVRSHAFDALVLDLRVVGPESRTFIERLRDDPHFMHLPVLFLSNKPTSRDLVDAFESGGDDFLPKPFRASELAARIFGLLRRAHMARLALGSESR